MLRTYIWLLFSKMSNQKKIAVIGAGPCGLSAIKSCKEVGFIPTCYEKNNDPGGLWRYHDEDIEGVASVMRTTIINTSKEASAFSDFPPPKEFPNFMHNTKMFEYFMRYAEHFNLLKHIRYNLEVVKVEPASDFDVSGCWVVSVKSTKTDAITKETFDAVMVCIGHHVYPKIPTFPDQAKFKGTITHTHSLKSCDQYKGKKVVVVGIGNSGVDAAVDATYVAEQVYLSTRRGSWIYGRLGKNGLPYDMNGFSRWYRFYNSFRSFDAVSSEIESRLNSKFDHELYKLKPKHRVLSAHPTMNDALPGTILSGRVIVKRDIEKFDENGIVFVGEDAVTNVDAVILATGYHVKFPFLDDSILKIEENRVHLYKYAVPPHLKHKTLAIIGLIQPIGPIFGVAELQSRWFIQIQKENVKLPTIEEMEKDIKLRDEANAKKYVNSTRHTIQVEVIPYMDQLAEMIGAKPNFLKMALLDHKLFWKCLTGPFVNYHYRLVGPHAWPGAREAILSLEDRVLEPLNLETSVLSKKNHILKNKKFLFIIAAGVAGLAITKKYDVMEPFKQYISNHSF